MPFKDYAVIALIALAAWICWDWLDTRDDLASESARHAADVSRLSDTVRSAHEQIERQAAERQASEEAIAVAQAAARRARKAFDGLKAQRDTLARDNADVRAYLDTRMPDALYDQLRPAGAADLSGQGDDSPARSGVHRAGTGPTVARPNE